MFLGNYTETTEELYVSPVNKIFNPLLLTVVLHRIADKDFPVHTMKHKEE